MKAGNAHRAAEVVAAQYEKKELVDTLSPSFVVMPFNSVYKRSVKKGTQTLFLRFSLRRARLGQAVVDIHCPFGSSLYPQLAEVEHN